METNPSTARSTKRRAELAAIAQKYGFKSWSAMLTAIKNGEASVLVWRKGDKVLLYPPAPAGTINGR